MDDSSIWRLCLSSNAGTEAAYFQLLIVLHRKGLIDSNDLDEIQSALIDMGGNYEIKPYQRASIEKVAKSFKMCRPDSIFEDPKT